MIAEHHPAELIFEKHFVSGKAQASDDEARRFVLYGIAAPGLGIPFGFDPVEFPDEFYGVFGPRADVQKIRHELQDLFVGLQPV